MGGDRKTSVFNQLANRRESVVVWNNQRFAAIRAGQCSATMPGAHLETFSAAAVEANSPLFAILAQVSSFPNLLCDF
jgi:hypothetical protein